MWFVLSLLSLTALAQDASIEGPTLETDRGNPEQGSQNRTADNGKSSIIYDQCEDMYDDMYADVAALQEENEFLHARLEALELSATALTVTYRTPEGGEIARIYPSALIETPALRKAYFAEWDQDIDLLATAPSGRCLPVFTADRAPVMAYDDVPLLLCDGESSDKGIAKEPPHYTLHVAYAYLLERVDGK